MHICFIEDTHLHGGTQIWVVEAARAFLERGEEVTGLAPEDSWVAENCAALGARVVTYDWDEVVKQTSRDVETWAGALNPCDVAICTVHPPRHGFHCSIFAAHCIKLRNLNTHLIPKTGTIVPAYEREFYLPDESIRSSVIAIADFTRRYLVETYAIPAEKIALIYQGTDVRRYTPSPAERLEAFKRYPLPQRAAPVLGSIGSFEHRKGHPVLFEAVAGLVSGPLPDLHLILVGDGPDEGKLKDQVKLMGLEGNITFFPFTDEPNYVFERIDITVLPSLYKEGLPNVLLESLSMHIPVVSSNLGGVPEAVIEGQTGYLVEPGDSGQLADAIYKLWSDPERYQAMSQKGRSLMEQSFDKEIQFDRFLEYFRLFC